MSSETRFSKGPWRPQWICNDEWNLVGPKTVGQGGNFTKEDANLIAAAPLMYEALRYARIFVGCEIGYENDTYRRIDAALAKAEGK